MQSRRISLQTTYPEFFVKGSLRELDLPLKKRMMKGYNFAGEIETGLTLKRMDICELLRSGLASLVAISTQMIGILPLFKKLE